MQLLGELLDVGPGNLQLPGAFILLSTHQGPGAQLQL